MKKITKEWLRKNNACTNGIKWFLSQDETNTATVLLKLVECGRPDDALWVIEKIINKNQSVRLAIFSARLCLSEFEALYPDDKRPRMAIEAAEAYIARPCEATKSSARSAAESAWSARSARSARSPASAAAWSAAWSAWSAAWSAARSAARSAAWSARRGAKLEIIREAICIIGLHQGEN